MDETLLQTKLFIPRPRAGMVRRRRLLARLEAGLARRLTLVSAAAGFGKTTLLADWVGGSDRPVAWLSLDRRDGDLRRFLGYLVAALQTVQPDVGAPLLSLLQSPRLPTVEALLTPLINQLAALDTPLLLVLDDYHATSTAPVNQALGFLVDALPPTVHLIIATREDPPLPLARLRARGELSELRAADLRFTPEEAAAFLQQAAGLPLSAADVAALERRTEGWIAGLQLAALALQARDDRDRFIRAFSGTHHFVLDYLMAEVLQQQTEETRAFLLQTSLLERFSAPLCAAVLETTEAAARDTLDYLQRANLFLVPLDDRRRWYRYHHLFGEFLRQRLLQQGAPPAATLHQRASRWYDAQGLAVDAFRHAAAAGDVPRAARLLEGDGMQLHMQGAVHEVLGWLETLPDTTLDAHPLLRVIHGSALLFVGRIGDIEAKLVAAEATLAGAPDDPRTRDLHGQIAAIRATLGVTRHDADGILRQAQRALAMLHPGNRPARAAMTWTRGVAHALRGEREAARTMYEAAIAASEPLGHFIILISATIGLGDIQETDNELQEAAATYRRVLTLAGDPAWPVAAEAHLGLARIHYQWNDLAPAEEHAAAAVALADQLENTDRQLAAAAFRARLALAGNDGARAAADLQKYVKLARRRGFQQLLPDLLDQLVETLLRLGNLEAAIAWGDEAPLPLTRARLALARGEGATALALLTAIRQEAEARHWEDVRLQGLLLEAVARQAAGDGDAALARLAAALDLAAPAGIIRPFLDLGPPMARLLATAAGRGVLSGHGQSIRPLLDGELDAAAGARLDEGGFLLEPLSQRELEVLTLISQGLSNREIGRRLHIALDTVKGHNRRIFAKLHVGSRTAAVAAARELGLL